MKAWLFYDIDDYRLEEVEIPEIKKGWVLVRPRVFQISVTEALTIKGLPTYGSQKLRQDLVENHPMQRLGHEFSGVVVEVGKETVHLQVGDRVVAKHMIPCHQCVLCLSGKEEDCDKNLMIGLNMPGCLAEYTILPGEALIKLPDSVDDHEAAALQPLSSCVKAVADSEVKIGDTVVILGQGVMGLNCMQLARVAGAGKVITTDIRGENVEMSKQVGADEVIHAKNDDPVERVLQLTGGLGADIVFECAGGSAKQGLAGIVSLNQAIRMVRQAGKIIQIAFLGDPVELDLNVFRKKKIKYIFSGNPSDRMWDYAVQAVASKKVKIKPTIGKTLRGLESLKEAVELTAEKGKYKLINPPQVIV